MTCFTVGCVENQCSLCSSTGGRKRKLQGTSYTKHFLGTIPDVFLALYPKKKKWCTPLIRIKEKHFQSSVTRKSNDRTILFHGLGQAAKRTVKTLKNRLSLLAQNECVTWRSYFTKPSYPTLSVCRSEWQSVNRSFY